MMPLIAPPRILIDEIVLADVLALFLSIATVSILWYVLKKIFPDEVKDIRFFLTFIIAIVPFVIIVYFGAAVINYNAMAVRFDWPEVLPLNDLLPPVILGAAAFYIGQTVWLWWSWRESWIPRGEWRRIAVNIAKLTELVSQARA
jgi:hypothetical protein